MLLRKVFHKAVFQDMLLSSRNGDPLKACVYNMTKHYRVLRKTVAISKKYPVAQFINE